MFTGIYDTNGNMSIYTNGVLKNFTQIDEKNNLGKGALRIGSQSGASPGGHLDGLIDEVGIWSVALSQTQIANLYNEGNAFGFVSDPQTSEEKQTCDVLDEVTAAVNSGACDCQGCTTKDAFCVIPFLFHSDEAGFINYSVINVSFTEYSNKTRNETLNLINYYSNLDLNLPNFIDFFEWIPSNPLSQGVTPYGQTINTPIFNISLTNYGGKNADAFLLLNGSSNCTGLYASTNNTQPTSSLWDDLILDLPFDIDARDLAGNNADGLISGATFSPGDNQTGLIAWYKLDALNDFQDYTGNGNDVVGSGDVSLNTNGVIDGAYDFDGNADYLSSSSLGFNASFVSITMRIKLNADPDCSGTNNWRSVLSKGSTSATTSGFAIVMEDDRELTWDIGDGSANRFFTTMKMPLNQWEFLAFTFNGTHMMVYNSTTSTRKIISSTTISPNTNDLIIGNSNNLDCPTGSGAMNATYDDLRIYNRSLSESEVRAVAEQRDIVQGNTYNFDGVTDFITILDNDTFSPYGNGSVEDGQLSAFTWVRPNSLTTTGDQYIILKGDNTAAKWEYGMRISTNVLSVNTWATNGNNYYIVSATVMNESWQHVGFVLDYKANGTGSITLYHNGLNVSTDFTNDTNFMNNTDKNLTIGDRPDKLNWNGSIGNLRLYNRTLTNSEIGELYNRSRLKYYDQKLTSNWTALYQDRPYLFTENVWLWADYNCSFNTWQSFTPDIYLRSCGDGVDVCSEDLL